MNVLYIWTFLFTQCLFLLVYITLLTMYNVGGNHLTWCDVNGEEWVFGGIQTQYKIYDMKNPECKQVSRVQRTELEASLGQA